MVIDLAASLAVIATKALVAEFIRGRSMDRESWATVGAEVVGAVMTNSARSLTPPVPAELQPSDPWKSDRAVEITRRLNRIDDRINLLGAGVSEVQQKVNEIQVRQFYQHMAAGRRYLQDLPMEWRMADDRRALIRDARHEFVNAVACADLLHDPFRQALAEIAIAACWLWVPSLPDVTNTIRRARVLLEEDILLSTPRPSVGAYVDVLRLCKAFGERPSHCEIPTVESAQLQIIPEARLAVKVPSDSWVQCAGIDIMLVGYAEGHEIKRQLLSDDPELRRSLPAWRQHAARLVLSPTRVATFSVRNTRADWIHLSRIEGALVAEIVRTGRPPIGDYSVAPGEQKDLTVPTRSQPMASTAPTGLICFLLDRNRSI